MTNAARREAGSRRAAMLVDVGVAATCAALVMSALLASGGIWRRVAGDDLHGLFLPKYEYAGHAARALHLPLWDRDQFCGLPLLGSAQGAVLYPPIVGLFAALDAWAALQAFYALHVLLLAWAMRRYLAYHGAGVAASALAAMITSVGVLGPRQGTLDHPSFLASVAWVPLALLAYERAVREGVRPWLGVLGLALGLQWLAGYPEFPLDMAVLLGLRALLDVGFPLGRRLGVATAGLALGAVLAAVQILPLAETVRESTRAGVVYGLGAGAVFDPTVFARTVVAEYTVPVLLLAVLALAAPIRARLAWLACLGWCLLGLYWPLSVLYRFPPYAGVRFPFAWRSLAFMFIGCLAGAGMTALSRRQGSLPRTAAAALALAAVALGAFRLSGALPGMPIVVDPALAEARAAQIAALRAPLGGPRLVSRPEIRSGSLHRHDLPSPTGYEPSVPPRRVAALANAVGFSAGGRPLAYDRTLARIDLAALLGVGLLTAPAPTSQLESAGFRALAPLPGGDVLLYRPPVSRARLVHRVVRVEDEAASLAHVIDHAGEAPERAVIEEELPALAEPAHGATERATIVVDEPEQVEVEALVAAAALLVVTDTFYPGWSATVDGVEAPIVRADHAFRGVMLGPGTHRVRFAYAPWSVRTGAALTAAAALVVLALCVPAGPRRLDRLRLDP
jgi:hypothetical protein